MALRPSEGPRSRNWFTLGSQGGGRRTIVDAVCGAPMCLSRGEGRFGATLRDSRSPSPRTPQRTSSSRGDQATAGTPAHTRRRA